MSSITINRNYTYCKLDNIEIKIDNHKKLHNIFTGDIVEFKNYDFILNKSNIREKKIVGILELFSKYKFPKTKRNIERFKFRPLSNKFPAFLVASKMKSKFNTNILVTIKYSSWEKTYPYGEIISVIGEVNTINNLYDGLLHKYDLISKKIKHPKIDDNLDEFEKCIISEYKDLTNLEVMSVDPENTLDIDDAFSIQIKDSNHFTIQIHISDVLGTLKLYGLEYLLDLELNTSIYCPHKTINMFPINLSEGILSLLPNKKRLAITMELEIKNNTIFKKSFYKSLIVNKSKLNYEKFNSNKYKKIINLVKNIDYKYKYSTIFDSHTFIEKLMIMYNKEVGDFLRANHKNIIFRSQDKTDKISFPYSEYDELNQFLSIIRYSGAYYSFENNYHNTLDLDNYIHFTSPIRRFADCYNHLQMHQIFNSRIKIFKINLDTINLFNKRIKLVERKWNRLKLEKYIESSGNHKFEGYIYKIEKNNISVFLPKYKLSIYGSVSCISEVKLYKLQTFLIYLLYSNVKPYSKLNIQI